MRLKYRLAFWISLFCVCLVLPLFTSMVSAQTEPAYYVTVKPTIENAVIYQSAGKNATLSFEAQWTYGSQEGQNVQNAIVTFDVNNTLDQKIGTLTANTTSGVFTFNYSSATPQVLSFMPTKLVTADGQEYNANPTDQGMYGLATHWAQVWWDTFHTELVDYDTSQSGHVSVSVNVTRLLLPQDGLFVGSVHMKKIVQNANVTINGVQAQETAPGIYSAETSTWLHTAYIHVSVAEHNWSAAEAGFSFPQNSNSPLWTYAAAFASLFGAAGLMLKLLLSRRASTPSMFRHPNFPFYGAFFLAATSTISLYWGIVGLTGASFGFSWVLFGAVGVCAFVFGLLGVVMALRKRNQAAIIFAALLPMFANVVVVKASLDSYQLTNPWLILFSSMLLSIAAGFFIANSDEIFQKNQTSPKQPL